MPAASSSSAVPLLGASRGGRSNDAARSRQAELAAAFGGSDDEDEGLAVPDYGRQIDSDVRRGRAPSATASASSSPPRYTSSPPLRAQDQSDDVFFDAGDALGSATRSNDPLGAERVNAAGITAEGFQPVNRNDRDRTGAAGAQARGNSYDFERASYFPSSSRSTNTSGGEVAVGMDSSAEQEAHGDVSGLDGAAGADAAGQASSMSRVRLALGRFGRLVGMRVPGATYSSLNGEDDNPAAATRRRRVVGSGIGQDGVFANLNAKPERRRRRGENGEDRGEDDDLADEILPPSYEIAAADSAPPYWETTIIGGPGGFHPLAPGGAGWTPGGAHVGALEDLVVEGLPVGNFFGFAWNLLVSMSFQFVGFLLTYLLHTTHAARCGSRAGLGITLVQYGFYLRTRAAQMAEGKLPDDFLGGGQEGNADPTPTGEGANVNANIAWWQEVAHPNVVKVVHEAPAMLARGLQGMHMYVRQATETAIDASNGTSIADSLANDDGTIKMPSAESMSASTEWLAYILMGLGWFIMLTALLSYWRVHRWGTQLVEAARRENEGTTTANDDTAGASNSEEAQADANAPVGFLHTLRNALRTNGRRSRQPRAHSAEDWVIFPGRPRRDIFGSGPELERGEADDADEEHADLSPEERRLIADMRSVGLIT